MRGGARPTIDGDFIRAPNTVDEVSVSAPELQYGIAGRNETLEIRIAQGPPQHLAALDLRNSHLVIGAHLLSASIGNDAPAEHEPDDHPQAGS